MQQVPYDEKPPGFWDKKMPGGHTRGDIWGGRLMFVCILIFSVILAYLLGHHHG